MKRLPLSLAVLLAGACVVWWFSRGDGGTATFSGTLERDEARIGSLRGGRVEAVFVREGDRLTNGQLVARLSAPELVARQAQSAARLAELEAGPRPEEIEAAHARWRALEAEAAVAALEAGRKRDLVAQGVISTSDFDEASARLASLSNQTIAAEQRWRELAAGTRPEQIAQARANLREAEAAVAELEIRAPALCQLESLLVQPGDLVGAHAPVASVLLEHPPWLRVYVPASWLGRVAVGANATIKLDAYPDRMYTGRVVQVSGEAEFTPRNVQTREERIKQVFAVKIEMPVDASLRAGMTADARFFAR